MVCIWVEPSDEETSKSLGNRSPGAILEDIDPHALNASLKKLASDIEIMLSDVSTAGGYSLTQIQVGVEVTAEAGFNLIGTGKVGGKAALTLSFSKQSG